MGSAGPAYRYVVDLNNNTPDQIRELDSYYIPESWYIQQYIEGGIFGGVLFMVLMFSIFIALTGLHPFLGALFAGVGLTNFFLHTFESSVLSLSLFFLVGIFLAYKAHVKK